MTNQHESFPDLMHEDSFEVVMRGYSRRQVHDYMDRHRHQIRDLEERLARAIGQAEQGRIELSEARKRLSDAPQDYDELGERLSQILKLGEEEAASKRQVAEAEAVKLRDDAAAESERLITSAQDRAEALLNAAQQEAERRVAEATAIAEQRLAQAGKEAEETVNAARAESEETLRSARAEADRMVTSARREAEQTVENARAEADSTLSTAHAEARATVIAANTEAHSTLSAAQQRANALDETTGRRVVYLTDTHHEVMRRLHEMGAVLGDLLHRESSAGPLVDEDAVLPPARVQPALTAPAPAEAVDEVSGAPEGLDETPGAASDGSEASAGYAEHTGSEGVRGAEPVDAAPDLESVRVIVEDDAPRKDAGDRSAEELEVYDDTDVDLTPATGKNGGRYAAPRK
ncbi:hypothetical protein [Streptosporangium amethystogenes]|uniref:hypothetical protein n=1 Tax=Streptosporangium amethystogenes TaxID=2002 RepID=UPI00069222C8|nr:hypothetical protein [Streptosporangium amethystogenes]